MSGRRQYDESVLQRLALIQTGQKATFTVDAFPGRSFSGEVKQVRKAATVVSNVVTYTVVVSASNPDLTLLPDTATLSNHHLASPFE